MVHDARQEFARRESHPSRQLRFKEDNGRALDGKGIYLRDERDQVTGQPSTVVVRPTVIFVHGRLLEECSEFGNLPRGVVPQVIDGGRWGNGSSGACAVVSAIEQ
jgi:G:T-mismatch repair DNA endonuclease (very short patch repair protein)